MNTQIIIAVALPICIALYVIYLAITYKEK